MYELEEYGRGEEAIDLAESAADQFKEENEEHRQAQAMILRHMASLDNYDAMNSLMVPYRLGKSHLFHSDFENTLNTFLDVWRVRNEVPEEESEIGIEYGTKAGCILLALLEYMDMLDSGFFGGSIPESEIREFVDENISIVTDEFQKLYAEVQIQKGEDNPLYERDELEDAEFMYPDQVDINEEDIETPRINREDIAICNILRASLQLDPENIS
jgi:hypothetical protein